MPADHEKRYREIWSIAPPAFPSIRVLRHLDCPDLFAAQLGDHVDAGLTFAQASEYLQEYLIAAAVRTNHRKDNR